MIGKLTGTLLEKNPPEVLLDCHGVGYEVQVPMSTFYNLPAVGERVGLLTQFIVREDAQMLYGFATHTERQAFRELIKISGVGADRKSNHRRTIMAQVLGITGLQAEPA